MGETWTMLRLLCGLLVCLGLAHGQVDITVDYCDRERVDYTVLNGITSGITFVETSSGCSHIIDAAIYVVNDTFATCGINVELDPSEAFLTFFVIVQNDPNFNRVTDMRFSVTCLFATNEGTVSQDVQTQEDALGDAQKTKQNAPLPVMSLYRLSDMVKLGTTDNSIQANGSLRLQLDLVPLLAKYDILCSWCYLRATGFVPSPPAGYTTKDIQFLGQRASNVDNDQCPNIDVFPEFTYTDNARSAYSDFDLFIPTVPEWTLTQGLTLVYTCQVLVCIEGHIDCLQPTCPALRRRRRAAGDDANDATRDYVLNDKAMVTFGGVLPDAVSAPGYNEQAEESMCLNIGVFFGILGALIFLMLAACLLTCYMFVMARRRRQKRQREVVYIEGKSPESVSDVSGTGSTLGIVKHIDTRSDGWAPSAFYAPYNFLPRLVKSSEFPESDLNRQA